MVLRHNDLSATSNLSTAVDLATPGTSLRATRLDECLEAFKVTFHPTRDKSQRITDILDDSLRIVLHLQIHACAIVAEWFETHDTFHYICGITK